MNPSSQSGGSSTSTILIVIFGTLSVLILGCGMVVVVCVAAITLLGSAASNTFERVGDKIEAQPLGATTPERATEEFLNDLTAGDYFFALNQASIGFQDRMEVTDLQALVTANPALRNANRKTMNNLQVNEKEATYKGTVAGPNGTTGVTLQLVKEGSFWKVDRISVP